MTKSLDERIQAFNERAKSLGMASDQSLFELLEKKPVADSTDGVSSADRIAWLDRQIAQADFERSLKSLARVAHSGEDVDPLSAIHLYETVIGRAISVALELAISGEKILSVENAIPSDETLTRARQLARTKLHDAGILLGELAANLRNLAHP